jgi:hypothetical protein
VEDTTPLRLRVEEIERQFRRLEEEWTDVYQKFRTMQMRVAKQVQRLDADSSQEDGAGSDEGDANAAAFSSLSPRAAKIQREILARRNRVVKGGE